MKKIVCLLVMFFVLTNVKALNYRGCDFSEIARMKSFINNINISYDYIMNEYPIFSITLNNIQPDVYFIDNATDREYRYQDTNYGEITIGGYTEGTSGKYKFYSANSMCYGVNLGSKYYKIPSYNPYYNDPLCDGLNIKLCDKWVSINYTKDEFESLINEYKNRETNSISNDTEYNESLADKIVNFYVKYYIYILLSVIISCTIIIIVTRKKDRFDL